jgi:nucleotide-binding universal stress UspA family protein
METAGSSSQGSVGAASSQGIVVVGVDGSDGSSRALAWALAEARLRHATLRVVQAWSLPALSALAYVPPSTFGDLPAEAHGELEAQVARVVGPDPGVEVQREVVAGPAAQAVLEEVSQRLVDGAPAVLGAALRSTQVEGERLRAKVGPVGLPELVAKTVEIELGPVRSHDGCLVVAFAWAADSATSLFPRLEADVEVAAFATSQTTVTLRGRYAPPAGALGLQVDRLLLHRLAQATVRKFLASLCAELDRV